MEENKQDSQDKECVSGDSDIRFEETNAETNNRAETGETNSTDEFSEKLAELQDRYLRLSAEFDNYRKRTLKERIDLMKTAGEDILKDLLPVADDFDRAIETMQSAASIEAISEGTKLIYSKFKSIIESRGLREINPAGENFDSDIHEAIAKIPADANMTGKIIDVVQKGYSLNDKIIRHPKVVVGE